jgi:hypothetical protein
MAIPFAMYWWPPSERFLEDNRRSAMTQFAVLQVQHFRRQCLYEFPAWFRPDQPLCQFLGPAKNNGMVPWIITHRPVT